MTSRALRKQLTPKMAADHRQWKVVLSAVEQSNGCPSYNMIINFNGMYMIYSSFIESNQLYKLAICMRNHVFMYVKICMYISYIINKIYNMINKD